MNFKCLIIIALVFSISSCQNSKSSTSPFLYKELEKAWSAKDSLVVKKWIAFMNDTTISDRQFYSMLGDLGDVTGFVYGNADPSESTYWAVPKHQRRIHMTNVAKVYELYMKSCQFMVPCSWSRSLRLQDRYWNDTTLLNDQQLREIAVAIDSLCIR